MRNKISIVSGGFDPVHVGHIDLFEKARDISDILIVILNSDDFLARKKEKPFMGFNERRRILESLSVVDIVVPCLDLDDTVCETLKKLSTLDDAIFSELCFCNGGDRTGGENTPEHKTCEELGIETVYGLGNKVQSSSWLTDKYAKIDTRPHNL